MAVIPDDLLAPDGEIEADAMFPGVEEADLDARLQAYIDQGVAKVGAVGENFDTQEDVDRAVAAWAYYRAFKARALIAASLPTSVSLPNEIATTFTDAQRSFFENEAARWLDAFDAMFAVEDSADDGLPPTQSTRNSYHFGG